MTTPKGIGTDILWTLIILAGLIFFISLLPLPPNDYWWHLRIGEYIYSHRSVPTTNMYSWALPANEPFFYAAWLGELLLYLLHRIGGVELTIFIRTCLVGVMLWLVASEARRRSGSWRLASLVIALVGLMCSNNLPVRTQIWAWLPFIIIYFILCRFVEGNLSHKWLAICPLCLAFWVNVHGSYILGIGLVGIFCVGETLRTWLKLSGSRTWREVIFLWGTLTATSLAALFNPRFTGIIGYTQNLLTNQPIQELIEEWQSPTPHGLANLVFFGSILLMIGALSFSRRRLTLTELLLTLAFLWLAWSGQRSVIWYGIVVMPILGQLISQFPIRFPAFSPQRNWFNLAAAILLFLPALLVQPWFVEQAPLPDTYWSQVQRDSSAGPLLSNHTPVQAVENLDRCAGQRMFNELGFGSYLIWARPEQGVFIDPRIELYPLEQWQDYVRISNGTQYNELLDKYGANCILLDTTLQSDLATVLPTDPSWELIYHDDIAQIWINAPTP